MAGIKVNGKFQKSTHKIKRCICAPHKLLTKFNPRGLGFVFSAIAQGTVPCAIQELEGKKKDIEIEITN